MSTAAIGRSRPAGGRWALAGSIVTVLAVAGAHGASYRRTEAALAARAWNLLHSEDAVASGANVWFGLGRSDAYGLAITPQCSSLFLVMPVAAIAVAALARRQLRVRRIVAALLAGVLVVAAGNVVRVATIAGLVQRWGIRRGYDWGHLVIGSVLSVLFVAASLAALALVLLRDGRAARAGAAS